VPHSFPMVSAIIAVTCAAACIICMLRRQRDLLIGVGILCLVSFVETVNLLSLPVLDPYLSPRHVAQLVRSYPDSSGPVVAIRLQRSWQYGLNFYLHREIEEWNGDSNSPAIAVISIQGMTELRHQHVDFTVIDRTAMQALVVKIGLANPKEQK
jgi:hypothetical protein